MKVILIGAVARNGVIGRTSKPCPRCAGTGSVLDGHGGTKWCPSCLLHDGRVPANDIPWNYPEAMEHFHEATMGHAVVMGRRTWESLPERFRPLPKRTNFVVTRGPLAVGDVDVIGRGELTVWECPTLPVALDHAQMRGAGDCFVIGGAQLYKAALPLANELDLTLIDHDYEGDVKFPRGRAFVSAGLGHALAFRPPLDFDLVERRGGEHPHLTFTKWVRR